MLSEIALKNADIDTIRQYTIMGTTVPGLEKIVASQIKELFPTSTIVDIQRGKVFFEVKASIMQLTSIKCVDNLYYFIKSMPSGTTKDDIRLLVREILSTPFSSFIPFLCSSKRPILIHVTASRSGKHSFSRTYVANMALQALLSCECFSLGDVEQHDLHFRLDVIERVTYLSIKITSAAYRYRGNNREFMPGAIRPSIANSLIWLSRPNKNDVVLDPFCGSGTIVSEREYYPYRKILAFDIEQKAVRATQSNVSKSVIVRQGDACNLPISNHCIDSLVTNAPWDVQIHSDDIYKLYFDFLNEAFRVLKLDGRCIVLTDKTEVLELVACELRLKVKKIVQLSLHGLHPCIFELCRSEHCVEEKH